MPLLAPLGVALGVLLPRVFLSIRPFVPMFFAIITLTGALRLRARDLGRAASSPLPLFFFFFNAHILMPLIILLLSSLIFKGDPDTISGYVLLYSVPTAVTGFMWVAIFKGDSALALTLILLDTLLSPLVVPGTVRLFLGTSIKLNMTGMALSLVFMIAIPTVIGVALNEFSRGKFPVMVSPYFNPLSKICMPLMIAANSAAVAPQVRPDNPRIWVIIASCIGFSVLSFTCAKLISLVGKLDPQKQTSLFFTSGLRNTASAITLGVEFLPASAALPAVLGIMFQQATAAIMGRIFLGKIGGEENTEKG